MKCIWNVFEDQNKISTKSNDKFTEKEWYSQKVSIKKSKWFNQIHDVSCVWEDIDKYSMLLFCIMMSIVCKSRMCIF